MFELKFNLQFFVYVHFMFFPPFCFRSCESVFFISVRVFWLMFCVTLVSFQNAALSSSRSPSMRRMRQLLDLDSVRAGAAPSPVPTPSGTLPRGQRQLDINPAGEYHFKVHESRNFP